ncbi:hypothetical protein N018_21090 [Pseudomonas syringae CC1557]|uniref:Uncharacterized protein n=1 Tax=Pseudomonas syringae CC1557 TaxID=1357279 RepID=W0MZ04_PSESX|nr:hypothetical protein [Pseudomonas syringae]AHG43672.1 hypothetical protein N018_21090 [Pseudomonas syringae CC1557]
MGRDAASNRITLERPKTVDASDLPKPDIGQPISLLKIIKAGGCMATP